MLPLKLTLSERAEGQCAAVDRHVSRNASRRAAAADLQRAAVDRRAAAVGVRAGQRQRARALLHEAA